MSTRQEIRSEETKRSILGAAGKLFAVRGFDAVSMREIAKEAGCSHTTIYVYFKDKEALLHQLSMGPLQLLKQQMEAWLLNPEQSADDRLKSMTKEFIVFCLSNRNMFAIFFMTRAVRVDEEEPALDINQLRNQLFGLLRQGIAECMCLELTDPRTLAYARIYFFMIHGILATYQAAEESADQLMERLGATFELSVEVMLAGFKQTTAGTM